MPSVIWCNTTGNRNQNRKRDSQVNVNVKANVKAKANINVNVKPPTSNIHIMTTHKTKFDTISIEIGNNDNDKNTATASHSSSSSHSSLPSPTTVKKLQQLKLKHQLKHCPQDEVEVETDIETPLSSPERETASTSISTCTPTSTPCTSNGGTNKKNKSSTSTSTPPPDKAAHTNELEPVGQGNEKDNDNDNNKDSSASAQEQEQGLQVTSSRSSDCDVDGDNNDDGGGGGNDGDEEEEDIDYSNWPLRDIKDPHGNDVLYGRGGGTNHHPGNKRYRKLVEGRKVDYVNSKRLDKPLVALEIIKEWRAQVPPGRFLKIDDNTGYWHDVGDRKAREKTSQALREKAPLLRKQQEEQRKEKLSTQKETSSSKNTRFDVPEKKSKVSKNLNRVMLARDHSLGRDYIPADEPVSVKGFSWTTPALEVDTPKEEGTSPSNSSNKLAVVVADWENPHAHAHAHAHLPTKSSGSWEDRLDSDPSSTTTYDPTHAPSVQSPPANHPYLATSGGVGVGVGTVGGEYLQPSSSQDAMPPPAYSSNWQQIQIQHNPLNPHSPHTPHTPKSSQTMMNEWRGFQSEDIDMSRKSYGGVGVGVGVGVEQEYRHCRSADDAYRRTNKRGGGGGGGYYGTTNPSNSQLQSGDYERFATIVGSNTGHSSHSSHSNYMHNWTSATATTPNRSNSDGMYKTPASDVVYDPAHSSRRSSSSGMYDASSYHSPDRMSASMPMSMSAANSYRISETWASPQPHATHSHSHTSPQSSIDYYSHGHGHSHGHPAYHPPTTTTESYLPDTNAKSMSMSNSNTITVIPRPPTVKRDTSHKMETMDVEPTTKRMNRQTSIGRRTASMSSVEEVTEKDMNHLNNSLEQSSLAGDDDNNNTNTNNTNNNESNDNETPPFHHHTNSRRPQSLKDSDRLTTIDRFIVDLEGKSSMLDMGIKQDIENEGEGEVEGEDEIEEGSTTSSSGNMNINIKEVLTSSAPARPTPLSGDDRISTLGTIDSDLFSGLTNAAPV